MFAVFKDVRVTNPLLVLSQVGLFAALPLDLSDAADIQSKVEGFMDLHGPIAFLVNCAGVAKFEPIFETSRLALRACPGYRWSL